MTIKKVILKEVAADLFSMIIIKKINSRYDKIKD